MTHELKVLPKYYKEILSGRKTFELRKNDRNYMVGDIVELKEWDGKYTGHHTKREITYILADAKEYGLADGYCILGLRERGWNGIQMSINQYGNHAKCIGYVENLTI